MNNLLFHLVTPKWLLTLHLSWKQHKANDMLQQDRWLLKHGTTPFEMLDTGADKVHLTSTDAADLKAYWMYRTSQGAD